MDALPYSASTVWVPAWYQARAASLPAGQVVLGFPFFNTTADLLGVQALYGMHYDLVGGTGPEWLNSRQGSEAPGYEVIKQTRCCGGDTSLHEGATAALPRHLRRRGERRSASRGGVGADRMGGHPGRGAVHPGAQHAGRRTVARGHRDVAALDARSAGDAEPRLGLAPGNGGTSSADALRVTAPGAAIAVVRWTR